jgi:Na+/H+ antiporter NhaD/arsenite permease-like protein
MVKYELLAQEHSLVKYNVRKVVLVEGNPRQERERPMKLAIGLSVVVFLLGFAVFGQPVAGITLALIAFPIGWIVI